MPIGRKMITVDKRNVQNFYLTASKWDGTSRMLKYLFSNPLKETSLSIKEHGK